MFHFSKSSVGWSNVDCFFWHFSIPWQWTTISTVFQSSFIESLATEFVLVTLSIVATLGFVTKAQHFETPEFFFKQSRLSVIMLLVKNTTFFVKKLPIAFAVKLSVQSRERIASRSFLFSGRILFSKFPSNRANIRESISFSSSSYFSVSQNF